MALKEIRVFQEFRIKKFLEGKRLMVTGCSDWKDYATQKHLGTKVEVVIAEDNTAYPPRKDGTAVEHANAFEKLVFKVQKDLNIPFQTEVVPVNPTATVFGDYQNQLSILADDIQVVKATKNP